MFLGIGVEGPGFFGVSTNQSGVKFLGSGLRVPYERVLGLGFLGVFRVLGFEVRDSGSSSALDILHPDHHDSGNQR